MPLRLLSYLEYAAVESSSAAAAAAAGAGATRKAMANEHIVGDDVTAEEDVRPVEIDDERDELYGVEL
jgi:hypothetical protein